MMSARRYTFKIGVVALLAGCAGSQPPVDARGGIAQRSTSPLVAQNPASRYQILYSFGNNLYGVDGSGPTAPLIDLNGTFYGTTSGAGADGYGTIFSMTTSGHEKVLHSFAAGPNDGALAYAGLIAVKKALYGTTFEGGHKYGTVFSLTPGGDYHVVYDFTPFDGPPLGGLAAVNGTLYGVTPAGGIDGNGEVFSLTPQGVEHVIYSFTGHPDGVDPTAALLDVNGTLYGTTMSGGAYGKGTVFRISPAGAEKVLFSFNGTDGGGPAAPLIAVDGTLYGTTEYGGSARLGTVFSLKTSGKQETVLHSFTNDDDGLRPVAGLIDVNGALYGTAQYGGYYPLSICRGLGCGIVFSVTKTGKERILHYFQDAYPNDGQWPMAGLIEVNGRLYGTTEAGGSLGPSCYYGDTCYGTVFSIKP